MAGNVASGSINLSELEERMKRLETTFQQNTNRAKSASPQGNRPAPSMSRPLSKKLRFVIYALTPYIYV